MSSRLLSWNAEFTFIHHLTPYVCFTSDHHVTSAGHDHT